MSRIEVYTNLVHRTNDSIYYENALKLAQAWSANASDALPIQDMATRERDDLRDAKAEEQLRRNKRMVARVEPPGVPDQKAFFR